MEISPFMCYEFLGKVGFGFHYQCVLKNSFRIVDDIRVFPRRMDEQSAESMRAIILRIILTYREATDLNNSEPSFFLAYKIVRELLTKFIWNVGFFNLYTINMDPLLVPLNCKHKIEMDDVYHRYGTYLNPYFGEWNARNCPEQNFFHWLDHGGGKLVDLQREPTNTSRLFKPKHIVSREKLDASRVQYFNHIDVQKFLAHMDEFGLLRWTVGSRGSLIDTVNSCDSFIYVIDEQERLYIHTKKKAVIHHSSFTSGGPVWAAGRIEVNGGKILWISAHSGHYLSSIEHVKRATKIVFGERKVTIISKLDI